MKGFDVSVEHPYFLHPCTGAEVYVLFDLPHLIKCLRNNLITHDIKVSSEIIIIRGAGGGIL
jgi:hypothetical protein